jgi:hypothetical protein
MPLVYDFWAQMQLRNLPSYNMNKGVECERRRWRKNRKKRQNSFYSPLVRFFYSSVYNCFVQDNQIIKVSFFPNTDVLFKIREEEEQEKEIDYYVILIIIINSTKTRI